MKKSVFVVDDHKLFRDGICCLINQTPDLEVVGETADGREAVEVAERLHPDLVLIEISSPSLNGVEAIRRITRLSPHTQVLAVSRESDKNLVSSAMREGASGYVLKTAGWNELAQAIDAVFKGQVYLSEGAAMVGAYVDKTGRSNHDGVADALTPREREVLYHLSEGLTSKEIAACLSISEKTIETHRKRIMDKVGIRSIAALTKYAIRKGVTTLGD